jgi:hypothetical protein
VADDDEALIELATKIFGFARSGDTADLVAYLDAGTPVNLANERGDTLIMLAAYHGHPDTVKALLEHGADPNKANDVGQTPLAGAVFKGEDDVIGALVAGGADPDAGSPSAVEAARMFGQDELLGLFER